MLASDSDHNPGAFAIENENGSKVIYFFIDEEDADRYLGLLEADDFPPMKVVEIEEELAIKACVNYNYNYVVVKPDEFLMPPR